MTKTIARPGFAIVLTAASTALLALIIAPFAAAFFAAAVFAGVMHPGQVWLAKRLGDRPSLAAALLCTAVLVIVIAPLGLICVFVVRQSAELGAELINVWKADGVDGLVARTPEVLHAWIHRAIDALGLDAESGGSSGAPDAVSLAADHVDTVAGIVTGLADMLVSVAVEVGVLVIALFFLLSQGHRLVRWIVEASPLATEQARRLIGEFRDVTQAVFVATVATAFLQTLIAAAGYVFVGVPYLAIILLVTFVAALIPLVGAALVVSVVGVFLVLYGDTMSGIGLIAWGVIPVGLCDNLAKPLLARGKLELPAAVVLFAMLGGVAVFGPMGVIAGPLIVAFFLASLRLLREEGIMDREGGEGDEAPA